VLNHYVLLETLSAQSHCTNLHGEIRCGKNIIYGENGRGNQLAQTIYLRATKSLKPPDCQEAIKFDEELAIVAARSSAAGISRVMPDIFTNNTKFKRQQ